MFFNSFGFAVFFIIVCMACLALQTIKLFSPKSKLAVRNIILLLASSYFYAFLKWEYIFLLMGTTVVNYVASIQIEKKQKTETGNKGAGWMWFAVIFSVGVLGYFKYVNFFIDSVNSALGLIGIAPQLHLLKIILPVGISFFTFQALTYTLDVYKGKMQARRNLIDVALFVSFFPTILSGPIERARNLLPQIERENSINIEGFVEGGKLFLWGLFKKVVIADRLAAYINVVYGSDTGNWSSLTLVLTAVLYTFQIYADFSGYSDMAIGIARMLGFRLMENFNYPYFATSIKDFWKRWHISLTSWFSEYVYIPLGGNRVSTKRWILNISSVFLLSGLWHGANWSFIVWGALHAIYYLIEHFYKKTSIYQKVSSLKIVRPLIPVLSTLVVFMLVTIAWVFFRIENVEKASEVIAGFFRGTFHFYFGSSSFTTVFTLLLLIFFIGLDWIRYKRVKFNPDCSAIGYAVILAITILLGVNGGGFVYFQF